MQTDTIDTTKPSTPAIAGPRMLSLAEEQYQWLTQRVSQLRLEAAIEARKLSGKQARGETLSPTLERYLAELLVDINMSTSVSETLLAQRYTSLTHPATTKE